MQVKDLMTKQVTVCHPATNAALAAKLMSKYDIDMLTVVADGGLAVGVVTDQDLFIGLGTRHRQASDVSVGEVMRTGVCLCTPHDDVQAALKTMEQLLLPQLPVVDEAGRLKGVLWIKDIALNAGSDGLAMGDVARALEAIAARPVGTKAIARQSWKPEAAVA